MTPNHLNTVRLVAQQFPALFQQNINASCFRIVQLVLQAIGDPDWGHVGKTAGEGQYTPPGFVPVDAIGSDGKTYRITGVSHDALKHRVTGQVVDILGQGNDSGTPIFHPDGRPMVALPQWNVVPAEHWRVNNPWVAAIPLDGAVPVPVPPVPVTPPAPSLPSYEAMGGDAFFEKAVGVPLAADYAARPQAMDAGAVVWAARTIHSIMAGKSPAEAVKRHRAEWRAALGLPPL